MNRFRASRTLMACVFGGRRMLRRYEQGPPPDVSGRIVPMTCAERSSRPCSGRPCGSNGAVRTALVAAGLALALVSGAARGQERPSLDVTLEWLRTKIPLAKHVDAQGDRWEWQPVAMDGCDIRLRETIHASDGPLVTEYAIRLGELRKTVTLGQWIWFYTREPTI